jgi:hypothetical protein
VLQCLLEAFWRTLQVVSVGALWSGVFFGRLLLQSCLTCTYIPACCLLSLFAAAGVHQRASCAVT